MELLFDGKYFKGEGRHGGHKGVVNISKQQNKLVEYQAMGKELATKGNI